MAETAIVPTHPRQLVQLPSRGIGMSEILFDPDRFAQVQRVAKMMLNSPLVPDHIRGKRAEEGMANIVIALALAAEMGENPIVVMQNIYFVSGKAGWSASYMIAKANKSGVFRGPIRWRTAGAGKDLAVTAYAMLAKTGDTVEATVDMKMADSEKWTRNDKYKSMPEHMLSWRSATFLIRKHCPEVMLGYHTQDELEDFGASLPAAPKAVPSSTTAILDAIEARAQDVEVEPLGEMQPEILDTEEDDREPGTEG